MAAASDSSSDEDEVGGVNNPPARSRESIRRQLANNLTNGHELERRDSSGLLELCFLNDILNEGDVGGNDPSSSTAREKLTLDELTARYIERNNISKKSNHVIVPLTPKSEEETSFLDEAKEASDLRPPSSDAEAFTAYLAEIQAEARQKLKAAKYEAARAAAESGGEASALGRDLKELIGERTAARISATSAGHRDDSHLTSVEPANFAHPPLLIIAVLSEIFNKHEEKLPSWETNWRRKSIRYNGGH